jgi:hypothetical protein
MKTNHQISYYHIAEYLNPRREAFIQTLRLAFLWVGIFGAILTMTSCSDASSPIAIDTPRTAAPDIVWETSVGADGTPQARVAKLNGVEPEATFTLRRTIFSFDPNTPVPTTTGSLTMDRGAAVAVFQGRAEGVSVRLSANSSVYGNYPLSRLLYTDPAGQVFTDFLANIWNYNEINTASPIRFITEGYTLEDNEVAIPGKVEITSHKLRHPFADPNIISHGQPLLVRWQNDFADADGGEILTWYSVGDNWSAAQQGIRKALPVKAGVNEFQFTAEEMATLHKGGRFSLTVRYYKAKSTNGGKAAIVAHSNTYFEGVVK